MHATSESQVPLFALLFTHLTPKMSKIEKVYTSDSKMPKSNKSLFLNQKIKIEQERHCSRIGNHMRHLEHQAITPSKFQHVPIIHVLSDRPKPVRHRSICSTKNNAEPCDWRHHMRHLLLPRTPNNNTFKFKHAPAIATYALLSNVSTAPCHIYLQPK